MTNCVTYGVSLLSLFLFDWLVVVVVVVEEVVLECFGLFVRFGWLGFDFVWGLVFCFFVL